MSPAPRKPLTPEEERAAGIYRKYVVRRLGGTPGKHTACEYFVLDWRHDQLTMYAMAAYVLACEKQYPQLARDIVRLLDKYYGEIGWRSLTALVIPSVVPPRPRAPIPMLLCCPAAGCGARHIDAGEFATKPHHTHACQRCGHVWRPAIEETVGVQFLPGFKDAP